MTEAQSLPVLLFVLCTTRIYTRISSTSIQLSTAKVYLIIQHTFFSRKISRMSRVYVAAILVNKVRHYTGLTHILVSFFFNFVFMGCVCTVHIIVQYSLWYLPMLVTRYLSFRLSLWADAVTRLNLLRILFTVHSTRSAEYDRFKQSISFHLISAIKIELPAWADTRENTV